MPAGEGHDRRHLRGRAGAKAGATPISASPPTCRPLLEGIDGFISVERFQSLVRPDKDAVAVLLARRGGGESLAQHGRTSRRRNAPAAAASLPDYRLRIAHVVRDYGMTRARRGAARTARRCTTPDWPSCIADQHAGARTPARRRAPPGRRRAGTASPCSGSG